LSLYKNLFKQTAIYGIAMVLPRMLSFFLVRLYTDVLPNPAEYGNLTIVLAYMVFFNVILSYGFETAFFRFYNSESDKKKVVTTATTSIFFSTITFLVLALLFRNTISNYAELDVKYITYSIWILALDALVVIPFSKLRANQQPIKYAVLKIGNVIVNLAFNFFFLLILPDLAKNNPGSFIDSIYFPNNEVSYILIANVIASFLTLVVLSPNYFAAKWNIDKQLWKKMIQYGVPILIAGIAFAINEHLDKILLGKILPANIAKAEVGAYSACYKIGLFMVLFRTAYTLGIEPFFFSHSKNENAAQTYATITKYFVIFGSFMSLGIIVFADVIKLLLLDNPEYWEAMKIVPLIIFANFFLGIYANLSVWYKIKDKTKIGAYISIVGAIVTLALNFILIPYISYLGSAIATIAAYGSMMYISYKLGQKNYPIPYDLNKILRYLGIAIVLSSLSFYIPIFRKTYIFGSLSLLFFGYYIYKNERNLILRILKRK
jgi:O-antigen/teichoic acid export membrane protein